MIKYGFQAWAIRKMEKDLLDVFHRNCQRIALGTRLTDRILSSTLYEKWDSIRLSMTTMRKKMRWLGQDG